jgi:hypothetical protein
MKSGNVMKTEELIKNAKNEAPNKVVFDLIEEFEGFAMALEKIRQSEDKEAQQDAFLSLMSESYDRLRGKMEDAASFYGMSFESLHTYIQNSMNFKEGDWAEVQAVKSALQENLKIPTSEKKVNLRNKNIKI